VKVGVNPSAAAEAMLTTASASVGYRANRDLEVASEADLEVLILIRGDELSSLIHRFLVTSLVMEALVTWAFVLRAIEHEDEPKCNAYL
jgi:hypothetical protein